MIKTIDDYLHIIEPRYPFVKPKEIKRIVVYGFNKFYDLVKMDCNVSVRNWRYSFFCRRGSYDPYEALKKYWKQTHRTLILKYSYAKEKYNGFYYVGLTDEEFKKYKKRLLEGKKPITFKEVNFYKVKEECLINKKRRHIVQVRYPIDVGWMMFKKTLRTKDYRYIGIRTDKNEIQRINEY